MNITFKTPTTTELQTINQFKNGLFEAHSEYLAAYVDDVLAGIVGWNVRDTQIYCCHAFVKKEFRNMGIYGMLVARRDAILAENFKGYEVVAHCNESSLGTMLANGYQIEKMLTRVKKTL